MDSLRNERYLKSIARIAKRLPVDGGSFLVTGASGMIGRAMVDILLYCNRFLERQYQIFVLGRNGECLKALFDGWEDEHLHYVVQNVTSPLNEKDHYDYIIHAASNADPGSYEKEPVETLLTSVIGTNNILQYCLGHKDTKVLFTSTFEVYGALEDQEIYVEGMQGIISHEKVRACYPVGKRCAENMLVCYGKEYDVHYQIARLSSIYGPTMTESDNKAHAQFLRNALKGKDIVLKSKGMVRRTYCYLLDAVDALFFILFYGGDRGIYNIANEKSVASIAEVARVIAAAVGGKIIYDEQECAFNGKEENYKPVSCILDNSKLRGLGWQGAYTLDEGIRETLGILSGM